MKVIELKMTVTDSNDRDAQALRRELAERGIFLINLMSAPGSGKTTLLSRTITDLADKVKIGVMEADIASDVDARRISELGAESIQVHTDGMCHMDAGMTRTGLENMENSGDRIVFLENVGNLICPAEFDTGAHKNVMILSVPEGDDKPLKYPLMFSKSDVLIITKSDAAPYFDFDFEAVESRVRKLNPSILIFPVSAKTGDGMEAWEDYILSEWEKRHA
ncbi:MAG: hydrogenase nickel incorporation protein HypB [Clostridia bacterium]|nr:hydrogenase nickel incorporation protein HypB [Clostridia bacterium]MBQ2110410.1 hydrogenase nickel incorporation protein HypB [Clostridia bacterium]MBQ2191620.1 hydrogenase nickel incorporation protein HypB [Clostridia bacterium]MBQ5488841.1 hydrogenase nickel incorporation protein HypB [Clostridia bacterium]